MNAIDQKNQLPELKPCPFCGGQPEMNLGRYGDTFRVFCSHPSCKVHVDTHGFPTRQEAAAVWNKRA